MVLLLVGHYPSHKGTETNRDLAFYWLYSDLIANYRCLWKYYVR